MFTVGQKAVGAWNWKYATAISPARMNAVGLVNKPRTMRMPPMTSIQAPIHICENAASGGIGTGLGGKLNTFVVPAVMKINPATIRVIASTRSGQGCRAGSKIDISELDSNSPRRQSA